MASDVASHALGFAEQIARFEAFEYDSLRAASIRLIRLEATNTPFVSCTIASFELSSAPPYTALSYTWDDQARYRHVLIDGRRLGITPNLEAFLRQACEEEDPRWFWIDAICINQSDYAERGKQVARMREIFETSYSMVVWLGDAKMSTEMAFKLLANTEPNLVVQDETDLQKAKAALEEIAGRSYWRRAWVLQEVTTPKASELVIVRCGNLTAPLSLLLAKIVPPSTFIAYPSPYFTEGTLDYIRRVRESREPGSAPLDLRYIFALLTHSQATDSRDLLYAPFLLVAIRELFPVDIYSLSTEELYIEFASRFIEWEGSLRLLHCCSSRNKLKLPSWVPDWTNHRQYFYEPERVLFDCGMDQLIRSDPKSQHLTVEGISLGMITGRSGATTDWFGQISKVKDINFNEFSHKHFQDMSDSYMRQYEEWPRAFDYSIQPGPQSQVKLGDEIYMIFGAIKLYILQRSSQSRKSKSFKDLFPGY